MLLLFSVILYSDCNMDSQSMRFLEEQFAKETDTRLRFHFSNRHGRLNRHQAPLPPIQSTHIIQPNPNTLALAKKRKEDEEKRRVLEEAREYGARCEDVMWPVEPQVKAELFDGTSKDLKGRKKYLEKRHQLMPEERFTYPVTSSFEYGWKLNDANKSNCKKPEHSRTSRISDFIYRRNGIPLLDNSYPFTAR